MGLAPIQEVLTAKRGGTVPVYLFDPPWRITGGYQNMNFTASSDRPHFTEFLNKASVNVSNFTELKEWVMTPPIATSLERKINGGAGVGTNNTWASAIYGVNSVTISSPNIGGGALRFTNDILPAGGASFVRSGGNADDGSWGNKGNFLFSTNPGIGFMFFFCGIPGGATSVLRYGFSQNNTDQYDFSSANLVAGGPFVPGATGVLSNANIQGLNLSGFPGSSSWIFFCNAFNPGNGPNIIAMQNNAASPPNGTRLGILSAQITAPTIPVPTPALGSNSVLSYITFDDPTLQGIINGGLGDFKIVGTNFGWLISFPTSSYPIVNPSYSGQIILLTGKLLVNPLYPTGRFYNPQWFPLNLLPQTAKSFQASTLSGLIDAKLDPFGIMYVHDVSNGGSPDYTYVATSFGLDIPFPNLMVQPIKDAIWPIALPSWCPCSPVAIPVGGG